MSDLYAINLRKEFVDKDVDWNDVKECIKQNRCRTEDWWIEQWRMWQELEQGVSVSVEFKED